MLRLISGFWLLFFCSNMPVAQSLEPDVAQEIVEAIKPYKQELQNLVIHNKNLENEKYYEKWSAIDLNTSKQITIKDLDERQKDGFYVYQAEILYVQIRKTFHSWKTALTVISQMKVTDDDPNKEYKIQHFEQMTAEIKKMMPTLVELHGRVKVKQLRLINNMIDKYKDDKAFVEELQKYLTHIKNLHKNELKL